VISANVLLQGALGVLKKTPGWVARHIKSSHGPQVANNPITPPSAMIMDVGLPIGETVSTIILVGRAPSVVSPCVVR
jgi:hypothetical protein